MDLIDTITELHLKGVPKKRIARLLGVSKNPVKKYLHLTGDAEQYLLLSADRKQQQVHGAENAQSRESVLKALLPQLNRELARQGVTGQLLWEEYKEKHPNGFSYGRFCDRIRAYRTVQSATFRLQHEPGQHMMVDFAGKKVYWVDQYTAEQGPCEVLACTLPYSGFMFAWAVSSQKQDAFVDGINQALLYRGGLPQVILSDTLKSYVKRSDRYEPIFTKFCGQFAGHYGVELQATRVARPQDKASVE